MTADLPSGVVTLLFTDIEGSTRRWDSDADGMRAALATHDEVLRGAIECHGGWMFKHTGDGVCAVFGSPKGGSGCCGNSPAHTRDAGGPQPRRADHRRWARRSDAGRLHRRAACGDRSDRSGGTAAA